MFRDAHQAAHLARELPSMLGSIANEIREAGSSLAAELSRPEGAAIAPEAIERRLADADADAERAPLTSNLALLRGMRSVLSATQTRRTRDRDRILPRRPPTLQG